MTADNEQYLGHPEVVSPTATPLPERGSGRWNIRRILAGGAIGAVIVPSVALLLATIHGTVIGIDLTPDVKLGAITALQVFLGGAIGALIEVRRQQNQRKILASS